MKNLIIFTIILLVQFSVSNSQWLEKEGYWELSEKIPDLRDLKIIPEENLVITVSKDNTIRHIEYDSGKILKSGKPAELTEDNDYAKISSDGKTTVVARYKDGFEFTDIFIKIIDNDNLKILYYGEFPNAIEHAMNEYNRVEKLSISFADFNSNLQELILSSYISAKGQGGGGKVQSSYDVGNVFISKKNGDSLIIIKQYSNYSPIDFKQISNSNSKHIMIGYIASYSDGGGMSSSSQENRLSLFNTNLDTSILFHSKYTHNRSESYPTGAWSDEKIGYLFPMNQVFENEKNKTLIIRSDGKLFTFDIEERKFVDSITNNIYKKDIIVFNNGRLTGQIDNTNYKIYSTINSALLSTSILPEKVLIPNPIIDEKNNRTIFVLESGTVIYHKLNTLEELPDEIIAFSKAKAYVGETIEIASLDNVNDANYKWEIGNEVINTNEKNFQYKFDSAGVYDIKLTITMPNSITHEFTKLQPITVNDSLKADFEILVQNSDLPLIVNFGDNSKGNIKNWRWDFGDGQTVDGYNPEHTYRFKGDFSPMLIIFDENYSDTIIKYEIINTLKEKIDYVNPENFKRINSRQSTLRNAFLMNSGINVNWTYEFNKPRGYQDYYDYFSEVTALLYDFNLSEIKIDSTKLTYWHPQYSYYFFTKSISKIDNDRLAVIFSRSDIDWIIYNFSEKKKSLLKPSLLSNSDIILSCIDKTVIWVSYTPDNASVIKTDYDFNILSELSIPPNAKQYLADTLDNGLNLIVREQNNVYSYFSISPENTIKYEKSFSLDTNISLSNIKSVHENLILLHGYYNDKVNNTTYAYFGKYHPLDNTLQDMILYSRKDIKKIERINNSLYAAIGQSRGRQGYLIIDTNLYQIKDIRVDSLTGEIKDMLLHDNKVYLFTEKIVSLETMALGAKESYQTTASVLSLPEDIIADVDDNPVVTGKTFTHSAYPNPANDVINLKVVSDNDGNYLIKLFDILGVEIQTIFDGFIPANIEKIFGITISNLPIGSYYYIISGGGIAERGKVMVVR